jgi:PAS domain S-box-containing protein
LGKPIHVLLVEDSEDDAALVLRELRRGGYDPTFERVQAADTMREALDRHPWDIILSDYSMPQFSAIQALETLKSSGSDLPFILISGTVGEETAVAAMRAGASDYLLKDNLGRLAPVVERELREARVRREQREAEEELAGLQEMFRAVIEASPVPIVATDLEGDVLVWNDASQRVFGWSAGEVIGRPLPFLTDEEQANLRARCHNAITEIEVRGHRRDGEIVDLLLSAAPLRDRRGTTCGVVQILENITDRKRTVTLLQESEKRYSEVAAFNQKVIDSSTIGISTYDGVSGQCVAVNEALARIVGGTTEKLRRQNFRQASSWMRFGLLQAADKALGEGVEQRGEFHLVTTFGNEVWLDCNFIPFNINGRPHLLFLADDITRRKRAEQQLRESEEQFRLIAENVADLIAVVDLDGKRVYNSPSYKGILGDPNMARGTISFNEIHPDDQEKIKRIFQDTVRSGVGQRAEFRFLQKDGSVRFIESQGSVSRDAEGKVAKVIVVSRDVTERKILEQQLLQAQKMEAIGQLAGGVAHDFNNLLTVINGYSQLLLEKLDPESVYRGSIAEIQKAGQRAAILTRQLLAFSRRQILAPQVIDLNVVVSEIEKMLKRLIGEDITLEVKLSPDLGKAYVDPGQIEQVITNLTVNARDAMPKGGRITIETDNIRLDEEYARTHQEVQPGEYVMLGISDTGHGMDAATRARIFEPFFTTKEKGKGTGLGLSMVHGIVKQSKGSIWVYSEPGQGTVFKIYFPRMMDETRETRELERTSASPARGGNETILVTEDQEAVRVLVSAALKSKGYDVLESSRGEVALQIGKQNGKPIHLLITDVVMPGIGGRELAQNLALQHPQMKVLYMSGYTDDAIVRHGMIEKGLNFIQKPFSPEALAHKVRRILDQA